MDTSTRIKNLISKLNSNNTKFAKGLGVAVTTIDGYTKGRRNSKNELIISNPNFEVIRKIVDTYNVNPYYILGLSDEMFKVNLNFDNSESVIEYLIENDIELSKSPLFKEYLISKFFEIKTEEIEKRVNNEMAEIRRQLLEKIKKN